MTGANGARRPAFDLDKAAAAARAAADHSPFAFTWAGQTYELPPVDDWELATQRLLADGELTAALDELLGADKVAELAASGMKLGDVKALFEAVGGEQVGTADLPNSSRQPGRVSAAAT